MAIYTNKKPSNLGLTAKGEGAQRVVAPLETFEAGDDEIPASWKELKWVEPATKDEAAAYEAKKKAGATSDTMTAAINTQPGYVEPAPAPEGAAPKDRAKDDARFAGQRVESKPAESKPAEGEEEPSSSHTRRSR